MYKLIIYLAFIYLCSCQESHNNGKREEYIHIGLKQRDKTSIYDIFSKIEVIPLETRNESLLTRIEKIDLFENRIYVFDFKLSSIFIFDDSGCFLHKISNIGKGPEEYTNLSDFQINKNKKELIALSAVDNALFIYDLEGNFIKKKKLPKYDKAAYKTMNILNNDTIAFWTFDYSNRMKYYSMSLDSVIHEDFPEEGKDIFCPYEFQIQNCLSRGITNTVFTLEDGYTKALYTWDFGKNNDVEKIKIPDLQENAIQWAKKIYASDILNYVISLQGKNDKYKYAQLVIKDKQINVFYDEKKKSPIIFEKTEEGANLYPIYWTDEYMIGLARPSIEKIIPKGLQNQGIKIKIDQLSDESNPFLIKYTF